MENYLPAVKKLRTVGGMGIPTLDGENIDPTLKRKGQLSKKMTNEMGTIFENYQFNCKNYRGALHELAQQHGNLEINFDTKLKSGRLQSPAFICTCKVGNITATGEARMKKEARQQAALAVLKKMGLVPEGYESSKTRVQVEKQPESGKTSAQVEKQPQVVMPKKTNNKLLEEREIEEEEKIYNGTVKYWRPVEGYGFISIFEDITFNDITVKDQIYVSKDDITSVSKEVGLKAQTQVLFKVYKDPKGLGAYEVMNEDGTPISFDLESAVDGQSGVLKDPVPETIVTLQKKEMKPIIENMQYVTGNFRGALLEYLAKTHPGVTLKFETELLQNISQSIVYIAKCKAFTDQNRRFKKLIVGTGYAAVKKSAIHFSALDFMLKLNLLTEAQHFQVHQKWSCY